MMAIKKFSILLGIFIYGNLISENQAKSADAKERTIKDILDMMAKENPYDQEEFKNTTSYSTLIDVRFPAFKTEAIFTGTRRLISGDRRVVFDGFKVMDESFFGLFKEEVEFTDGQIKFWLPIQESLLSYFDEEMQKGFKAQIDLRFLAWIVRAPSKAEKNPGKEKKAEPIFAMIGFGRILTPQDESKILSEVGRDSKWYVHSRISRDVNQDRWFNRECVEVDSPLDYIDQLRQNNESAQVDDERIIENKVVETTIIASKSGTYLRFYRGLERCSIILRRLQEAENQEIKKLKMRYK